MGWLSGWQYRKSHEIEGSTAGAQTNYQIRIIIHKGSGTDGEEHVYCNNHCRDDFGDIRFTKSDGTTLLDYWMEEYTSGDNATFWVEVPSIPASPDKATIYIYYGKSDAATTSNGEATFLFFDDFEGTSLDTSKWTWTNPGGDGSYTISNSELDIDYSADTGKAGVYSSPITKSKCVITVKAKGVRDGGSIGVQAPGIKLNDNPTVGAPTSYADSMYFSGRDAIKHAWFTGSWASYDMLSTSQPTEYKLWQFVKDGNSFTAKYMNLDYSVIASHTATVADYTFHICLHVQNDAEAKYDWVYVRNYVDPEPSHGSWGNEEQSGATEVAITDSSTGIEALSRPYRGLNFTDIATGQESFSRPYRQLQIPEQASGFELLLKTRNLNLGDIAASLEIIERARQIGAITDTAQSLEQILKQRFISLIDAAAGGEIIARPTRMTILADEALSQEILSKLRELTAVTDSAIGIEYVNVGAEGAIKTRIFLLIGDLAIQITGD